MNFRDDLAAAWRRTDELFGLIAPGDWLERPIGLRHPFLFYLGHLPAFAWNQVGGALNEGAFHETFDVLFARGIDPHDDDAPTAQAHSSWPALAEIHAYRDAIRAALLERVDRVLSREDDPLCRHGRVLHIVLEHEHMHHETLLYMMQEFEGLLPTAPMALGQTPDLGEGVAATKVNIPTGVVTLGANFETQPFGWDNEFGELDVNVPAFELDSHPVRVRDFLAFVESGAYSDPALWEQEDRSWAPEVPGTWKRDDAGQLHVRWLHGTVPVEQAAGWPVQVSFAEALAYAHWKGARLPSEAELNRAAYTTPDGGRRAYPWGDDPPRPEHGRFGYGRHSPSPVGAHPAGVSAWGIHELVGNGWEWTRSVFAPLPGFKAWARTYPGYSVDFFDDWHQVVFGASWATDLRFLRRSYRNWYQRRYPFVFSKFRLARSP